MDFYDQEAKIANELGVPARNVCVVGSTLICGGGNDVDFLCLVPSESVLNDLGFLPDAECIYETPMRSFRRGDQNLIVTTEPNFFFAELAIAHGARLVATSAFDMSQRDERIRFHSELREKVLARMVEELF